MDTSVESACADSNHTGVNSCANSCTDPTLRAQMDIGAESLIRDRLNARNESTCRDGVGVALVNAGLRSTDLVQTSTSGQREMAASSNMTQWDACSNQHLINGLIKVLAKAASRLGSRELLTKFHSLTPPKVSIADYISRLRMYFFCSDSCFLVALIYMDRVIKHHPHIQLCSLSCHRLFVAALIVTVKFYEDTYYSNAYYAKAGGLVLQEINELESGFLQLLDWKLIVEPHDYAIYFELLRTAALSSWQENN